MVGMLSESSREKYAASAKATARKAAGVRRVKVSSIRSFETIPVVTVPHQPWRRGNMLAARMDSGREMVTRS
jgi:hypothetical protein